MTPRQMDALRFITGYQEAKGYCPSYREIAEGVGYSPKTKGCVKGLLDALEERGHIRRMARKDRAIEVLTAVPVPRGTDGEARFFVRPLPTGEV